MSLKFFVPLLCATFFIWLVSCERQKKTFRVICKHSDRNTFEENEIITYEKDLVLMAQLKTNGKFRKEVTLNEGYMPIIPAFVKELESISTKQKCSTIDSYTVYIDNKIINQVDRTCEWKGFERLKNAFFEQSK